VSSLQFAIPGELTTAHLLLKLWCPDIHKKVFVPYDRVIPLVVSGGADAGVVIHESRFTYPVFIKPVNLGSSVGVVKAHSQAELRAGMDQAVQLLKPGGTLMLVGIPTIDRVSFTIDLLRRKEIRVQNVRRQNECMAAALELIASGKADVDFMVTHRFGLAQAREAFDLVASYRDGVIKAMINLW